MPVEDIEYEPQVSMRHATWRFRGHSRGELRVILPERTTHPEIEIYAWYTTFDQYGYWNVYENGGIVAGGRIKEGEPLWRNGMGPRLECERVISAGATLKDKQDALEYESDNR